MLDDHCLDRVLGYVREAPARATCRSWAGHLYEALQLERTICVMQRIAAAGSISFHYVASRDLGPDITESVDFQYEFFPKGRFLQQYSHSLQGDLADVCVDVAGSWRVERGYFICEAAEVPAVDLPKHSHYSSPREAVRFKLPIDFVIGGATDLDGDCLLWERSIKSCTLLLDIYRDSHVTPHHIKAPPEDDEDASYVEVDGRRVRVCEDIREYHPEASWETLMRVRVRVGLV
jgi:hypothetical protein